MWPTNAEDISLFIMLCRECDKNGEELSKEVDLTNPYTSKKIVPYKKIMEDWGTPLNEYIMNGKLRTESQKEQSETILESENFMLEKEIFKN